MYHFLWGNTANRTHAEQGPTNRWWYKIMSGMRDRLGNWLVSELWSAIVRAIQTLLRIADFMFQLTHIVTDNLPTCLIIPGEYPILVSFLDVAPVGMWVAKCNSCGYPLDIACSGVQQCPNIVTKHFTSDLIITIGIHRILMCSLDLLGWPRQRRRRKPKLCAGVLGFRLRRPFAAILLRL